MSLSWGLVFNRAHCDGEQCQMHTCILRRSFQTTREQATNNKQPQEQHKSRQARPKERESRHNIRGTPRVLLNTQSRSVCHCLPCADAAAPEASRHHHNHMHACRSQGATPCHGWRGDWVNPTTSCADQQYHSLVKDPHDRHAACGEHLHLKPHQPNQMLQATPS